MKTLLEVALILILSVVVIACLDDNGSNYQTFTNEPLIVNEVTPTTIVDNGFVNSPFFYAPMLDGTGLEKGQCMFANFRIDYEKQTTPQSYTINEWYGSTLVDSTKAVFDSISTILDIPLYKVDIFSRNSSETFLIDSSVVFMTFAQRNVPETSLQYRMIYNDKTIGSASTNPSVYVYLHSGDEQTNPSSAGENSSALLRSVSDADTLVNVPYAFDVSPFLYYLGGTAGKTLNIEVMCYAGKKDEKGQAIFEKLGTIVTKVRNKPAAS